MPREDRDAPLALSTAVVFTAALQRRPLRDAWDAAGTLLTTFDFPAGRRAQAPTAAPRTLRWGCACAPRVGHAARPEASA